MSSYFYDHIEKNTVNAVLIDKLDSFANEKKQLVYVIDKPLGDSKYTYNYEDSLIILSPKSKILIINYGKKSDAFDDFADDLLEDIGSISDKYLYKEIIGRPRTWKVELVETAVHITDIDTIESLFESSKIIDDTNQKKIELLISLFIGSINDIDKVREGIPKTRLDKVKQKIQLFDGDQTRFIYQNLQKKIIRIQGLSGTGKTELLLHKIKDLYTSNNSSRIFFTCFNKILADNLRRRIPQFFNFLKVEQQIEWESRLWCSSSWGSTSIPNSGAYRYICAFYKIPFYTFSYSMPFSKACSMAIQDIQAKYADDIKPAFDYMFIDEGQDFDEEFFNLCALVTNDKLYIAGDIFQSIFDEDVSKSIEPDFLLGKCYRTDPKTLMFAHALGMGLFEEHKLRWLEEKDWKDCGYNFHMDIEKKIHLTREPLRRFEDIEEDFESIEIVNPETGIENTVLEIMHEIVDENPTITPDDIGIIFLDSQKYIYNLADSLEIKIFENFSWKVNKAYESKIKTINSILISNRNNVKGLEFPFVICITKYISPNYPYRNAIYTMLTRSFIKSYLIIPNTEQAGITSEIKNGLKKILKQKEMVIDEPSDEEKVSIQTRFKYELKKMSHYDRMIQIFKQLDIERDYYEKLLNISQELELNDLQDEMLVSFVKDNYKYLQKDTD